ncbi:MAG: HD domain-containing protein [Candidatus Micrarchaeota archaeon]
MEALVRYIFEAGMLKKVKRSGWWSEKVDDPESVAEHTFRTAVIAFALARMEGLDAGAANRLCTAAVFHDMHETRLLDLNKITARYITVDKELEGRVEKEQVQGMEPELQNAILGALALSGREAVVLKDADYLECAIQAKEYADIGHKTEGWLDNIEKKVQTESAKTMIALLKKSDSKEWLKGLKRL